MKAFISYIIIISFALTQFKSERQNNIESLILAPCCYGGIVSEHNSMITKLISNVINSLIEKSINEQNIKDDLNEIIDISIQSGFITHRKIKYDFENRIHSNMQDNDILNIFINIYGEKIRAIPQNNFFGKITWFFPLAIFFGGTFFIFYIINNLSKKDFKILSNQEILNIENKIENYNRNKEK